MMNQSNTPLDRGLPYKEMGPIDLDPITVEVAADLQLFDQLEMALHGLSDHSMQLHRTFDAALLLYERLCCDNSYDGLSRTDLFTASLHTAMIWELG